MVVICDVDNVYTCMRRSHIPPMIHVYRVGPILSLL